MTRKPTMSDIAAACGVSQATVSLVLNNAPGTRISTATREAVQRRAQAVGYQATRRAVDRHPLIAMLINDVICSPHVAGLIDGVADAAADLGFLLSVMPTGGDDGMERAALDHLAAMPVAGVIYTRLITQAVVPPPQLAVWPAVLLNCHAVGDALPSVVPGDLAAGTAATLALIDAGHRRIAFIGGEDAIEASRERLRGYRQALAQRGIAADAALVIKAGWTITSGFHAMRRLLALPDPPTAVFCFCDRTAMGVYNAAQAAGLAIPDDLSVIGFDNEAYTADMLPPLTTMELPHADMARHAVEVLAGLIAAPQTQPRHSRMRFDCPMILRGSVAAARMQPMRGLDRAV